MRGTTSQRPAVRPKRLKLSKWSQLNEIFKINFKHVP